MVVSKNKPSLPSGSGEQDVAPCVERFGSMLGVAAVSKGDVGASKFVLAESTSAEPGGVHFASTDDVVARKLVPPTESIIVPHHDYFEKQGLGAWCGMHALHVYLRGPYVTREACVNAARVQC